MNVIALRPRGFIPYWNHEVYARYSDWARWFWKGAVHIDDVAAAVMLSIDLISRRHIGPPLVLTLDSAYEYTDADLADWDAEGPGSTFRKYYPDYYDLALSYGLDPTLKPTRLDISETIRWLGYQPSYSLASLLSELAAHGDSGPPRLPMRSKTHAPARSPLRGPIMARPAASRSRADPSALPDWIRPQLTQLVDAAPEGEQWLHEIKYDGFRMHARLDRGAVRLLTRNGLDWTHKYPQIATAVAALPPAGPISTATCAACAPTASPRSA